MKGVTTNGKGRGFRETERRQRRGWKVNAVNVKESVGVVEKERVGVKTVFYFSAVS